MIDNLESEWIKYEINQVKVMAIENKLCFTGRFKITTNRVLRG